MNYRFMQFKVGVKTLLVIVWLKHYGYIVLVIWSLCSGDKYAKCTALDNLIYVEYMHFRNNVKA